MIRPTHRLRGSRVQRRNRLCLSATFFTLFHRRVQSVPPCPAPICRPPVYEAAQTSTRFRTLPTLEPARKNWQGQRRTPPTRTEGLTHPVAVARSRSPRSHIPTPEPDSPTGRLTKLASTRFLELISVFVLERPTVPEGMDMATAAVRTERRETMLPVQLFRHRFLSFLIFLRVASSVRPSPWRGCELGFGQEAGGQSISDW